MRRLLAPLTTIALLAGGLAAPPADAAPAPSPRSSPTSVAEPKAERPDWQPRPATYPKTVTQTDLAIPMSDGTVLRGDLMLPADAAGNAVTGRLPVLLTITAYNKSVLGSGGALGGGEGPAYLVQRGYAQLTVDARGTGSSEGVWEAFSEREYLDDKEIVEWAHSRERPWSNGRIGMRGPSYMGINQIFTAAQRPKGLKAIFPQVPAADVYRDVVASGGAIDVGFIPLWLGLVTTTGIIPPATTGTDPASGFGALLDHLYGAGTFTVPLMLNALLGGDAAYDDGPFYRQRSPIEVVKQVKVPTFLIGGQQDLFQRGTPLLFEQLQQQQVPTRMIIGPWDHLQGSSGNDVGLAGHGSLAELQLRWFDRWLGGDTSTRLGRIPAVTTYEEGSGTWRETDAWITDDVRARSYRLSGGAVVAVQNGTLTSAKKARPGTADVPPLPVSGLCTRSANQWTAGLPRTVLADLPCWSDNALNDRSGIVYETEPVSRAVRLSGPINARLFASSPTGDGMFSVSVSDVAPSGKVTRLSGGWQVISLRELDEARSRYVGGKLLQPYHPFTRASEQQLAAGEVGSVDVEVFPTAAKIRKGHRLRIAVQAFDVPHLLPTVPDLPGALSVITLHASDQYPSELTIPWVRPRKN
jgi:putative CocE/NonD family hydrolase